MSDTPHIAAFICEHVFRDEKPVLYAAYDEMGWQFLCGDEEDIDLGPRVVGIGHIYDRDPSLLKLRDLASGWEAERGFVGDVWIKNKIPPDEDNEEA